MAESRPTPMPTTTSMMMAQIPSRRLATARSPTMSLTLRRLRKDSPRSHWRVRLQQLGRVAGEQEEQEEQEREGGGHRGDEHEQPAHQVAGHGIASSARSARAGPGGTVAPPGARSRWFTARQPLTVTC